MTVIVIVKGVSCHEVGCILKKSASAVAISQPVADPDGVVGLGEFTNHGWFRRPGTSDRRSGSKTRTH